MLIFNPLGWLSNALKSHHSQVEKLDKEQNLFDQQVAPKV